MISAVVRERSRSGSSTFRNIQVARGGDQCRGRGFEILGASHQVRLMGFEKLQHRGQQRGIACALTQIAGIEPGNAQQPRCAIRIRPWCSFPDSA